MASLDELGQIDTTELASGAIVVSVTGCLDGRSASALRDTLLPLTADDGALVVLDLSEAHGIDEDALAVIARAAHLMGAQSGRLLIVCRSRTVNDQIVECGIGDIVRIHDSIADTFA